MEQKGKSKRKRFTKKRIKMIIGTICLLLIIGFGISSYSIGLKVADGLIYLNKGNDTKGNSRKQLALWGYDIESFEKQYTGKKMTLTAEDSYTIPMVAYYTHDEVDNDTVILVHGLGGDYVSIYPQAQMYLNHGWNVIALDQRGSGESSSDQISFGYFEKRDIKAIVNYVKGNIQNKKLIIQGFSMGAVTTGLYAGTEHATNNVDGVILDSAFDSMESMFREVWKTMDVPLPIDYVVWCGNLVLKVKYGFGFDDANVLLAMKKCQIPVLIIQGEQDDVATVAMGETIYKSISAHGKEYWLNDSKHVEAYMDYPVQYKQKVMNFIY